MSVLSLRHLGKRFGPTAALSGIDLDIGEGARTAIVGPSGSGKTTLLRLIAGFEAPDEGVIRLDGRVIADATAAVPAHRRNIGLVMQEGALFPHLSVIDNIRFGIGRGRDSVESALGLMDLVELDRDMATRPPHQLSGGQQQRVALARALARRPRLMLLDEPFSALDAGLREHMRDATAQILSRAGVSTVLVTHDRDEAMGFADQLVVLRRGGLVQAGRPRDLYLRPVDPETARFLGPALVLPAQIRDGRAHTVLGDLGLPTRQRQPDGAARILLRPEQIRLEPDPTSAGAGRARILSVEHVGPMARVALELAGAADPRILRFETSAASIPRGSAPVAISISGEVHRFT